MIVSTILRRRFNDFGPNLGLGLTPDQILPVFFCRLPDTLGFFLLHSFG